MSNTIENSKLEEEEFDMAEEDYAFINIVGPILQRCLQRPNLTPFQIITLGYFKLALERLPLITPKIDVGISISKIVKSSDSSEIVDCELRISEDDFSIECDSYSKDDDDGGNYESPSWSFSRNGGDYAYEEFNAIEDLLSGIMNFTYSLKVENHSSYSIADSDSEL
jgi:hypothetical protein